MQSRYFRVWVKALALALWGDGIPNGEWQHGGCGWGERVSHAAVSPTPRQLPQSVPRRTSDFGMTSLHSVV